MQSRRPLTVFAATYAVLFLTAAFLPNLPEGSDPDRAVIGLLSDPSSRLVIALSGHLWTLAGLALLPWLAAMALTVWRIPARSPGSTTHEVAAVTLVAAGVVHVVMLLTAGQAFAGYALGVAVGELEVPRDATLYRVLSDQGFGHLLVPGLLAAGVMMLSLHIGLRGTGALPGWVARVGVALTATTLLGFTWAPQFVVPLWVMTIALTARVPEAKEPVESFVEG